LKIKFKKEYEDKLIELGVRNEFEQNFRDSCMDLKQPIKEGLAYLNEQPNFLCFFSGAFDFSIDMKWIEIFNKLVKEDKDGNKQNRESGASNRGYLSSTDK